jgi:hypothetical protein
MLGYIRRAGEWVLALAGIVMAVRWVQSEPVMAYVIPGVGYAALILSAMTWSVLTWRRDRRLSRAVLGQSALAVAAVALMVWGYAISLEQWANSGTYMFGTAFWTLMIVLWERSKAAHKTCPACISKVDARASVCRHCGHAFPVSPRLILPPGVR